MDKRRLLLIVVCSFASAYALHVASRRWDMSRRIDAKVTAPASAVSAISRSLRPNYPYSVIPGGAYSPAELRFSVRHDRVVKNHYADFNIDSARLVKLTEDRFQYVSYRLKNQVYWTRKKLRIPKGEVLLTDGSHFARTRCGNRLSSTPNSNTAPEQPSERMLSLPPFSPPQLKKGEVTLASAPPVGEIAQEFPDLPFDLPRLAPYIPDVPNVPAQVAGTIPTLLMQQLWLPISGYPAALAPVASGFAPIAPNLPAVNIPVTPTVGTKPTPPVITITPLPLPRETSPPIINEVPEPASLSLFASGVCLSLWLLARMMRRRRTQQ